MKKELAESSRSLLAQYVNELSKIYGNHIKRVILYGSYARGDFNIDSDVDIMILSDMTDSELSDYNRRLLYMTYDFNTDNDIDIQPIAKNESFFKKWVANYPFYANIQREGIDLYNAK